MPVSVIMPALNAGRFIDAALRSLMREREAVELDVIVVDDGSSDDTRAIVASLAREFPEVRLLRNPRKGIAAARNTGLDSVRAEGRFVTFLDADDLSFPGRIARQRSLLLDDPTIDALYGTMVMFAVAGDAALAPTAGSPTRLIRGPYLQSSMYRRAAIDRAGRFDESFRQGDDTDFILRVVDLEMKVVLDDGVAAYYRRHDANVTLDVAEVQREFMRASLRFAARRRMSGKGALPPIYSALFLSRDQIEKEFGA
jgi:glycosyltransferase involved in cell wall biosynthesis